QPTEAMKWHARYSHLNYGSMRIDNGTEHTINAFQKYVKECGILHQFTVPYTPQ
ncbi:unnamed protein product, partial [Ceratitis capitata]